MRNEEVYRLMNRLLELSIKNNLGHIGSCMTTIPILYEIYSKKTDSDSVVLSSGHAGLALYVILEHFVGLNAQELLDKHGIHPDRDLENKIDVSTGSLGLGITVAVGMALGNKSNKVYCVISDGECAEGSVWESLRFIDDYGIDNIEVHCNANGWSAYQSVDTNKLEKRLKSFYDKVVVHKTDVNEIIKWKTPLSAHYTPLDETSLQIFKELL